jgi:hypothetical protein
LSQITKQLRPNEKILWQGKPVLMPFVLPRTFAMVFVWLVFIVFSLFGFYLPMSQGGAP